MRSVLSFMSCVNVVGGSIFLRGGGEYIVHFPWGVRIKLWCWRIWSVMAGRAWVAHWSQAVCVATEAGGGATMGYACIARWDSC